MKLLQFNKLEKEIDPVVSDSFDRLPETSHKDGKYRLRRFSGIELRTTFWDAREEADISLLEHRDFIQSDKYNKHQGGMVRKFEEIEEEVLQSSTMKEICLVFKKAYNLIGGQELDVHQMRVRTLEQQTWTPVAPEGVHQDGFNYIAMVAIARDNIDGGALMAYDDKDSCHFMTRELQEGEMLILNDKELWHNASPIRKITANVGYGDWFVLCARTE